MRLRLGSFRSWKSLVAGTAWIALALPGVYAQGPTPAVDSAAVGASSSLTPTSANCPRPAPGCPTPYFPSGGPSYPGAPTPGTPGSPGDMPSLPGTPGAPGSEGMGTSGDTGSGFDLASQGSPGGSAVGGEGFSGVGYIDSAIPVTQYRLRVDAANGDNRPDRADFFYPKCGCFRALAAKGLPGGDPNAPGPGSVAGTNVNYQEITNYLEFAANRRLSGFVEIPVRYVNISFGDSTSQTNSGLSDINFGFKAAVLYNPGQVLTFQFRTYSPTGNAGLGLGRNNWNLEPALLYYQRLTSNMYFEGELRDFIPVASADDFAGNVLRYGGGLSYLVYNRPNFRIAPVAEVVGWSVLSGKELAGDQGQVLNAAGNTIVNAKIGVRIGFGQMVQPGFLNRADVYVGYGRALTGDVWYKNIARAEFRLRF